MARYWNRCPGPTVRPTKLARSQGSANLPGLRRSRCVPDQPQDLTLPGEQQTDRAPAALALILNDEIGQSTLVLDKVDRQRISGTRQIDRHVGFDRARLGGEHNR